MNDVPSTILVCDDDRLVLATLVHGLKEAGYRVIEADNGDDAILLARQWRPDLALLDMRMNGKSGLDVAAYLRDHVGTPFMFLSAFNDEQIVRQAVAFGALAYLVKPLDVRQIVPAVESALARSRGDAPSAQAAASHTPATVATPRIATGEELGFGARVDLIERTREIPSPLEVRALALGVLMERHRLDLSSARLRLERLATDWKEDEDAAAARIVTAVITLNGQIAPRA